MFGFRMSLEAEPEGQDDQMYTAKHDHVGEETRGRHVGRPHQSSHLFDAGEEGRFFL